VEKEEGGGYHDVHQTELNLFVFYESKTG